MSLSLNWSKASFAVLDSSYLLSASFDNTSTIWTRKAKSKQISLKMQRLIHSLRLPLTSYCLNFITVKITIRQKEHL